MKVNWAVGSELSFVLCEPFDVFAVGPDGDSDRSARVVGYAVVVVASECGGCGSSACGGARGGARTCVRTCVRTRLAPIVDALDDEGCMLRLDVWLGEDSVSR